VITVAAFVLVAGLASLARAEAGRRWNRSDGWPAGTFAVNIVGSFLLGLIHDVRPPLSTVVAVGGLGALTTFSSFSRDAVALVQQRRYAAALAYVGATVIVCVAGAAAGLALS
jgi:CrcB protein